MKKALIFIVVFITLLAIPITVFVAGQQQELRKKAAPATTLALTPATKTVAAKDTFSLEVIINTGENKVVAAQLHILYDPTKLEATSITNGPLAPNVLKSGKVQSGQASITVGATNKASPISGTGTIAVVRFKAKEGTPTPITVRFSDTDTFVGGLDETQNVLIGKSSATIGITGKGEAATPTTTTTPSVTPTTTLKPTLTPTQGATGSGQASSSAITITSPTASGNVEETPTITGKAAAGAVVTLTIYSTPQTVVITADANGNWSYTPNSPLEPGEHSVVASITDETTGKTYTATTAFVVGAGDDIAGDTETEVLPTSGAVENTILILGLGILLILSSIVVPTVIR